MPKQRKAEPGEINYDFVDRFTLVHFTVGVGMGVLWFPWWAALIVAVGWELIENTLKDNFTRFFPNATHDTWRNATGDAIAMMAGWGSFEAVTLYLL